MPENEAPVVAAIISLPEAGQQLNENVDDTRFEVPTEIPVAQAVVGVGAAGTGVAAAAVPVSTSSKSGTEVVYQEVNFINASTNDGFTIPNEEKDLETRLRYKRQTRLNKLILLLFFVIDYLSNAIIKAMFLKRFSEVIFGYSKTTFELIMESRDASRQLHIRRMLITLFWTI